MKVWKTGSVEVEFVCVKVFDLQGNKNLEKPNTSVEDWTCGRLKVFFS